MTITETDPSGVTRNVYDNGDLIRVTDPLGNTYRYHYDQRQRLSRETDPGGAVQTYSYESTLSPVPETGTWALLLAGLGALGAGLRRRRAPAGA